MRSWKAPHTYKPIVHNVRLYEGPSQLTGSPILVIASANNGNRKIGEMLQLWILTATSPLEAVRTGADEAICGDCALRGDGHGQRRACYVEHFRAPENIWQARAKARVMTPTAFGDLTRGLQLRIGAYGDPVAVPIDVWQPLLETAGGWTAYTHQWRRPIAAPYRPWCMASVDSLQQQREASALGWRTFRVRSTARDEVLTDEVACPASEEAGHRTVCAKCELCRGAARPAKHIVIVAHGQRAKWFGLMRPTSSMSVAAALERVTGMQHLHLALGELEARSAALLAEAATHQEYLAKLETERASLERAIEALRQLTPAAAAPPIEVRRTEVAEGGSASPANPDAREGHRGGESGVGPSNPSRPPEPLRSKDYLPRPEPGESAVLALLRDQGPQRAPAIAAHIKESDLATRDLLNGLKRRGLIDVQGATSGRRWYLVAGRETPKEEPSQTGSTTAAAAG